MGGLQQWEGGAMGGVEIGGFEFAQYQCLEDLINITA